MRVHFRNLFVALIAIAIAFTSGRAQTPEDKTLAPYFVVQGDPSVDHLPLKDTRVEISVSGVIADVKVRQIYRNEGSRPINASYVFPASTRAAVYSMHMQIGNEIIVAKIKEREQAKQDFEKAKEEGKSASLLEQQRPNVFSMSLANLMPQEQVEIELRYTELLIPTDNVYEITRVDDVPIVDALGATIKMAEALVDLRRSSGLAPARRGYYTDKPPRERVKELIELYGMNHLWPAPK